MGTNTPARPAPQAAWPTKIDAPARMTVMGILAPPTTATAGHR